MDTNTGLAILGTAIGSAKLVEKLLGPTADYVGEGLKTWTENRVHNVRNIFRIALKRLGNDINKDGAVPPRVLKSILEDGSFCDDPLMAEYFGGVLASSRSNTPSDDRGAALLSVVTNLSAFQVRSHYIFYSLFKRFFTGCTINTSYPSSGGPTVHFYMPFHVYAIAMGLAINEDISAIAAHSLHGLDSNSLIQGYSYGEPEMLRRYVSTFVGVDEIQSDGFTVSLSPFGAELFNYVHHRGEFHSVNDFLNPETIYEPLIEMDIPSGSIKLTVPPEREGTAGVKYR